MPFAIAFCLAAVAGLDLDTARELPWRGYVDAQIMRLDDRVLPPPPNIAVYFGSHKEAFAEMQRHPEAGESYCDQMLVTEILVAHALAHHDWDDLQAAWENQRMLWQRQRPQCAYAALHGSQLINAAARKLPPPAPRWFSDFSNFDARRAFAEAWIADASRAIDAPEDKDADLFDRLGEVYLQAMGNDWKHAMAIASTAMAASRACDTDPREYDDRFRDSLALWNAARWRFRPMGDVWHVVARFTAERELTERILETRAGGKPSTSSRCSDGSWIVTPGHVRFSKRIEGTVPLGY